ncbi:MAG TPA: ribonuclease E/G, partial [Polyangiaceae bacterium]|nr:ribonuclease E/G [Polyangiaceae bacterium]
DMDRAANREFVLKRLAELLQKDKAQTTLNPVSELGLIEMTRKRTRESLGRMLHEPCFYCDGTGQLQSRTTIALEILRQIRREHPTLTGYQVTVNAHPAVVDILKNEEREALAATENRLMRRIELVPRREYHIEQFDLQGK